MSMQISDMAPPNAPVVPNGTAPGVFVRGTLRMPREGLFDIVNANLKQSFGGFEDIGVRHGHRAAASPYLHLLASALPMC